MRNLILIFGDQLNHDSAVFDEFDADCDAVWMAEVDHENSYVWSHQQRIVFFLACMRHFRDELREKDIDVHYHELTSQKSKDRGSSFTEILRKDLKKLKPEKLVMVLPGDFRVKKTIESFAGQESIELETLPDHHFYCSPDEFSEWAKDRKSLLLETFYRQMRKQHDVLMNGDEPTEDKWNFDHDNRESFSKDGPDDIKPPRGFRPDETTEAVIEMVKKRFADHPGKLDDFNLPVNRREAKTMLREFIKRSLSLFGKYEDAMWMDEPFVYHSRLSAPLNVKLINPKECVEQAVAAYVSGDAPINSVEGFVRQLLGWREFIRGIYWLKMPKYQSLNYLEQEAELPSFYWDGETDMTCVQQSMKHVIDYGYSHHIHRLMVLGNLSLLLGVDPYKFHEWHMAMYVDAVDWVSLPNTLGMSQHGDGGIVGTKPYVSTGNYIHKMSNFCKNCKYNYKKSTGEDACPISTLYWDFLDRNYDRFKDNHRMAMMMKNVDRKREKEEMEDVRKQAKQVRKKLYKN